MIPTDRFSGRLLVFAAIIAVPFARLLVRHHYGVLYPEVAVAFLILAAVAAALAAVSRPKWAFPILVAGLCVVSSVSDLQRDFFPDMRFRYLVAGVVVLVAAALLLLRRHFYTVLLVFVVGGFVPDLLKVALPGDTATAEAGAPPGRRSHVVHIVFDEMLGIAGAPPDCAECVAAAGQLTETLKASDFRIYPRAFSNYNGTRDSLSSILNARLLNRANEYVPEEPQRPYLRRNAYFDYYHRANYDVRAYQMDYLLYASPELPYVKAVQYDVVNLSILHRGDFSWTDRLGQVFNVYVQSDPLWRNVPQRIAPGFWDRHPIIRVGSLAMGDLWPDRLVRDIRNAGRNTLFFAHLLTPHAPYVRNADGAMRGHADWNAHMNHAIDGAGEYRSRYALYAGQYAFLNRQIGAFVEKLKEAGLYDDTTLILHGDHGSRIRLLRPEERQFRERIASMPGQTMESTRYDYAKPPSSRDLLDQFSALLAIKLPGARAPEIVGEAVPIVRAMTATFRYAALSDRDEALDSVYLFDPDGKPRGIDFKQAFEEGGGPRTAPDRSDSQ